MKPRALFVSFFDGDATDIIKSILSLDVSDLPLQTLDGNIVSFPYDIDTKYYTSSVDLCTFDSSKVKRGDLNKSLVEDVHRVEAFVAYFSTNERGSFLQAAKCSRFMKESNSNVKILVCDGCLSTDEMSRHEVLQWCIGNGFELVELHDNDEDNVDEDDDDEAEEDDFKETKGVQRIIEALRCNSWSNMVLKDRSMQMSPYMKQLRDEMTESLINPNSCNDTGNNTNNNSSTPSDCNNSMEKSLENLNIESDNGKSGNVDNDTEDDDDDSDEDEDEDIDDMSNYMGCDEKFETLFKNIPQLREEASSMPFEERKKYAENVVKQFWRSIGGDMSEFDDD